ncbi:hypothetical protein [Ethanoligenens sp.]|uniref:hypothetical protein n=1 Tax=Ethanoligenens sp. TaxID=2099655 RepID=UPI0039EC7639
MVSAKTVLRAVCTSCHRAWEVSNRTAHVGYICPDCAEHIRRLHTAKSMQQLVQTAAGMGFITEIEPDGMIDVDVSGRPCKFWPLDVEPARRGKW